MKESVIKLFKYLWYKLHKKKQPLSIKIEAENSKITLTIIVKD